MSAADQLESEAITAAATATTGRGKRKRIATKFPDSELQTGTGTSCCSTTASHVKSSATEYIISVVVNVAVLGVQRHSTSHID